MKRIALTIILIVVLASTTIVQARGRVIPIRNYPPRFSRVIPVRNYPPRFSPVIVRRAPRVTVLPSRRYGYGYYGRDSKSRRIAVIGGLVLDAASMIMQNDQINREREHEIRVIGAQQKQVIKQEQRDEELARLQYEIEKARLRQELERLRTNR